MNLTEIYVLVLLLDIGVGLMLILVHRLSKRIEVMEVKLYGRNKRDRPGKE